MRAIAAVLMLLPALSASAIDLRTTPVLAINDVVDVVNAGDGSQRLYLAQQSLARVRVLEGGQLRPEVILDIADRVNASGDEQGLLSIAFPPGFAQKRYFYAFYTDSQNRLVLSRFRLRAASITADPASEEVLLRVPHPTFTNHNGGKIAFGPDGFLYLSIGDGGGGGDPPNNAQSLTNLLGKIVRLDTESGAQPYAIPPSNPFIGLGRSEIWAYGLRNPWRIAFDRATNDLYIADVGQQQREEVNVQAAGSAGGQNYGWRIFEGTSCFGNCDGAPPTVFPVAEYDHSLGCSITGGHVYRGGAYPGLVGTYLYGDFCSGIIFGLSRSGSTWTQTQLRDTPFGITTFGEDERGNVYVYDRNGGQLYLLSDGPPVASFAPIGAGFTGTWFDPAQSGHGLFVEILPNNAMVVAWFTFRPEGGQAWFIGSGDILGDRAVIQAVYPQGGRFIPNFDPNAITRPVWGTLTLTFDDCNNGRVEFASVLGFGSGSMRLTRLTNVAGVSCP